MSPDDEEDHSWLADAQRAAEAAAVLMRREIAEQASSKPAALHEGLKVSHFEGRWLPTIRSRESYEQALQGDGRLLGERVRSGAISHDERDFIDDFINGRIKPGKGLYNQRRAKARQPLVADFVSKMKRKNSTMRLKTIVHEAMKRFRISRTEVFNSIAHEAVNISNKAVAERAEVIAKAASGKWIDHVAEARKQLEDEIAKATEAKPARRGPRS